MSRVTSGFNEICRRPPRFLQRKASHGKGGGGGGGKETNRLIAPFEAETIKGRNRKRKEENKTHPRYSFKGRRGAGFNDDEKNSPVALLLFFSSDRLQGGGNPRGGGNSSIDSTARDRGMRKGTATIKKLYRKIINRS